MLLYSEFRKKVASGEITENKYLYFQEDYFNQDDSTVVTIEEFRESYEQAGKPLPRIGKLAYPELESLKKWTEQVKQFGIEAILSFPSERINIDYYFD